MSKPSRRFLFVRLDTLAKGGKGSGNYHHNGRKGKRGGSEPDQGLRLVERHIMAHALPWRHLDYSEQAWRNEFPDGVVNTPVGTIKIGENQHSKLSKKEREHFFGLIRPTLETPAYILADVETEEEMEERRSRGEKPERASKLKFIQAFQKPTGGHKGFSCVTVSQDGLEVSVHSGPRRLTELAKMVRGGAIIATGSALAEEDASSGRDDGSYKAASYCQFTQALLKSNPTALALDVLAKAEQLGLFDIPVHIKPFIRKDGTVVQAHVATRKKRIAPKAKQPGLFGAAEPANESARLGRLGHFIEKHGGYRRLLSMLESFPPEQKDKLLASMAKLSGKTSAEIADILANGAKHEAPKAEHVDLFAGTDIEAPQSTLEPVQSGTQSGVKPAQQPHFTPTHELPDGTPVVASADEPGVWIDAQGDEYESEDAYPISDDATDQIDNKLDREQARWETPGFQVIKREKVDRYQSEKAKAKLDEARDASIITEQEHKAATESLGGGGPGAARDALERKRNADKLRKVASSLLEKSRETQNADRRVNTARRARMAASILDRTAREEAAAKTMLNLADAIESGEAKHVAGLNTLAAVNTMDNVLHRARLAYEQARNLTYAQAKAQEGRPYGEDDLRHVAWPDPMLRADWVPGLRGALRQAHGGKALADAIHPGPLDQALYDRIVKVLGRTEADYHVGWYAAELLQEAARLRRAGIDNTEALRAAAREYVQCKAGQQAIDPVKAAEMALAGQQVGVDFFPTPKPLAERMAELADIRPGMLVLEPSAGKGNLADVAKAMGGQVDVVEISDALRKVLEAKGYPIVERDFEDYHPGEVYDRIIMNPPFGRGTDRQDAAHIQRAFAMLKPGGKLVAIAGEGVFNGADQAAAAFRDWLSAHGATVEKLPNNSFMDRAETHVTSAATRLVTIEKPVGSEVAKPARMKNYSWDAVKLSDAYSMDELNALRQQVEREHANPLDAHGSPLEHGRSTIYLYDKAGRKKLAAITWAVTYKLQDKKREREEAAAAATTTDGPQEGERNAEGLVFRAGRWHRDDATARIDDALDAEDARLLSPERESGALAKAMTLLAA